jgi:diacylglycerol kinase
MKEKSLNRFINGFKYAFCGIKYAFKNETNMVIHILIALIVITFGFIFNITNVEWLAVIIIIGLVIAAEMINTSLEVMSDLVSKKYNEQIKAVKDTAAGAVLVLAVTSVVVGIIVFLPYIMEVL